MKRLLSNTWKTLIWPVAIYLFFLLATRIAAAAGATTGLFGNWNSIETILKQTMLSAMMALAMAPNMINGRWDFSIGIIMMMSSFIASPLVTEYKLGPWGLLLICVLSSIVMCMVNAALYLLIKIPSLVISIGMLMVYETLVLVVNNGAGARMAGQDNTAFGRWPMLYILGGVMLLLFYVIYTHTRFGYNVRSLGNSQIIARNIGVNETKNTLLCYLLCGVFIGVAATLNVSMKGSIESSSTFNNHMGMMFGAFPAVFIGLYLARYTNFTFGGFIGAFTMKTLSAGILALALPAAVQDVGVGLFLLLFITLTTNQARFGDWRARKKRAAQVAGP